MSHQGWESFHGRGPKHFIGRKARLGAVAVAAALIAGGTYAAISAGDERDETPVEQLKAEPTGPGRFARAYGLSATEATHVFTLGNGIAISVAANATAKCLFASRDQVTSETCHTITTVNEGKAIGVTDECGSAGDDRMAITGLAPESATKVQLKDSDGSTTTAIVDRGAFRFEGTNPAEGEPYPTGVVWLSSRDEEIGNAALPVEGDHFCLPAS